MSEHSKPELRILSGGIESEQLPREVEKPTEDDLIILIRWLLRHETRLSHPGGNSEHVASLEMFEGADFNVQRVYRLIHWNLEWNLKNGGHKTIKDLIDYTKYKLLPHVKWEPAKLTIVSREGETKT